jgi:hypothetical protein
MELKAVCTSCRERRGPQTSGLDHMAALATPAGAALRGHHASPDSSPLSCRRSQASSGSLSGGLSSSRRLS